MPSNEAVEAAETTVAVEVAAAVVVAEAETLHKIIKINLRETHPSGPPLAMLMGPQHQPVLITILMAEELFIVQIHLPAVGHQFLHILVQSLFQRIDMLASLMLSKQIKFIMYLTPCTLV